MRIDIRNQTSLDVFNQYLFWIEVLLPIGLFLEELARAVSQKLVVGDLKLECSAIPLVIQFHVIGMDESQFLACTEQSIWCKYV